jgi:hypothetical protein
MDGWTLICLLEIYCARCLVYIFTTLCDRLMLYADIVSASP